MQVAALIVLGLGAYALTVDRTRDVSKGEQDASSKREQMFQEYEETGIFWGNQRVSDLNVTGLNSANKPYSAPRQDPTGDISDINRDQADRETFLEVYHPPFFFRDNTEIPYTSAAAGVYSGVEIPGMLSIRGDPGASLARLPRTYIDCRNCVNSQLYPFTGEEGTLGAMGASQPAIWEEVNVPETGQLNFDFNPYGVGGAVQNLMNVKNSRITRERGTDRSTIIGPPVFGSGLF